MRTPNLADRLSMANAAKKAQLERAKHMAEDPERAQRLKARDEIVAARNRRITEREGARSAARQTEAAEMAVFSPAAVQLPVQFVGRYFAEATLFQVARAWERAAGTNEKHPSLD